MDLREFLTGNDRIDSIDVVTFAPLQPSFVVLRGPENRITKLSIEMRDIEDRFELGILKFCGDGDPSKGDRQTLAGGRVLSWYYLAVTGFDVPSGVRITLENAELIITSGDMPYSIFVSHGSVQKGRPEYPIEQYRPLTIT